MRTILFSVLILFGSAAIARPWVRRDANGYAQWPHSNYDGTTTAPCYERDKYPGEETKWSLSTSEDPVMVEQYRRALEEYDRVHGTHKNPYPPR